METDTLSSYKSTTDMHLLQETMDKTCLKNGSGLHDQNSCDTSDGQENDTVCLETESKEPSDAEWTRDEDCNDTENQSINKKDDVFDSDVEEEEEHVPLNIETTSDIEKSDDDLDDCNETPNNYDSEKEENCKSPDPVNECSDPLDISTSNHVEKNELSEPDCSTNDMEKKSDTSELPYEVSSDDVKPLENNKSNDTSNDESTKSHKEEYAKNNEHVQASESDKERDADNHHNLETPESCKDANNVNLMETSESDKKKDTIIVDLMETSESNQEKGTDNKDSIKTSESGKEKDLNNDESIEPSKSGKGNDAKDDQKNKPEGEKKNDENVVEISSTEKESENKKKEIIIQKELEDKSEENTNKTVLEDEIIENAITKETEEKYNKKENGSCPLLMESLMKKNDKETECEEDNREDDMDEALFDPSLLCPDISMEVDEDPVITTNDAPPPPQDGNKSPMLYEPIFSTFVDEMTGAEVSLNLSLEEEALRQETYGEKNPVQFTKIHCTACNVHLGSALDGQGNRFVHPLLKVLICKNCYHFYTSGEFEKDEDGSELYCRWCGQGGQVMCCSNCEMVFCKKCIRINFDRKKLAEIRDSDDWLCFRCNPSQLTIQRIHCAEFMEYVRREISRAATLDNATSFMTIDYSQCCATQKKKATDTPTGEPKKKKRKVPTDPDYDPFKDREETDSPQPSTSGYASTPNNSSMPAVAQKPPNIVSYVQNQLDSSKKFEVVQASTNSNSPGFKIGSTTFRPRTPNLNQSRPRYQIITPTSTNAAPRPKISGPGYIKILPGGIRVPGNAPTPRNTNYPSRQIIPITQASTTNLTPPVQQKQPTQPKQQPVRNAQVASSSMKHEWFEKTVRAAARVNSNLSYTLTQLNRAQANAQSVEALAVVHNKLQEILSTSINSLIQIRKNLRTEFIAGIKNIRFPPAAAAKSIPPTPAPTQKPPLSTDDDVIFISPSTSPVPPSLIQKPSSPSVTTLTPVNLPPSISFIRKTPNTPSTSNSSSKSNVTTTPVSTKSSENNNDRPKTFLRVKSLTALQNVPSECITIPDDPLPPPPPLTPIKKAENSPTSRKGEENDSSSETPDIVEIIDDNKEDTDIENKESSLVNGVTKQNLDKFNLNSEQPFTYNLNEPHSEELNNIIKNMKIILKKSTEVEQMVKAKFNPSNGDMSD